jgi:hypothetical protein
MKIVAVALAAILLGYYNADRTFVTVMASELLGLNLRNFNSAFLASALLLFQYYAIP